MTTERSYRSAMSHARARDELRRESGRQFDPGVVRAFLETFDERREERPAPAEIPLAQSPGDVAAHLRAVLARAQA
jgi:HD-GYP domain-containing protein (c-di-GMP phosphodiesterase class II)